MTNTSHRNMRAGVTLIELMIVLLIMMAVSAMMMTAAAPSLESRRVREAARITEVTINRARNRALQTVRPAGIWLERVTNLSEACTTLSFCETPEPYGGDFPNSGVTVINEEFGPNAYGGPPGAQEQLAIVVPHLIDPRRFRPDLASQQPLMYLDVWHSADPNVQQVIRPGDMIQFNYQGPWARLESTDSHPLWAAQVRTRYGGPMWYYSRMLRRGLPPAFDRQPNQYYVMDWFNNGDRQGRWHLTFDNTRYSMGNGASNPDFFTRAPTRYRIMRQPIKSADPSITLPEGTVIDLNYSGTKRLNFHPRLVASYNDPTVDERVFYGKPPNPFTGFVWRWGTEPSQIGPPQFPDDATPVIITFDSRGLLDRVYMRTWDPLYLRNKDGDNRGSWEWSGNRVLEPIHLLIGKREKLPAPLTFEGQLSANWTDVKNIWVTINPQTGYIGSSENAEVPPDVAIHGLKGHGNSWGDVPALPNDATFFDMSTTGRSAGFSDFRYYHGLDHMGYGARRIANQQFIMGGR